MHWSKKELKKTEVMAKMRRYNCRVCHIVVVLSNKTQRNCILQNIYLCMLWRYVKTLLAFYCGWWFHKIYRQQQLDCIFRNFFHLRQTFIYFCWKLAQQTNHQMEIVTFGIEKLLLFYFPFTRIHKHIILFITKQFTLFAIQIE